MDNKVNFLRGTSAEYESSIKDNDTFYYTTDDEKLYLGNKEITGGGVTVDDTLSDTSKNPVQNKVITNALNTKANLTDIPTTLPADGGNADTLDGLHESSFAQNIGVWSEGDIKDLLLSCSKSGFVFIHPGVTGMPSDNMYWFGLVDCNTMHRQLIVRNVTNNAAYSIIWNNGVQTWTVWNNLADGGNADTVDGLHANGFIKVNSNSSYDCNTLYDTGLYLCGGSTTNTPNGLIYGTLLVMPYRKPYGNAKSDFCAQIFIPNGDGEDTSLWYRTSLVDSWNEWTRSCDGGNADTVDGKHASDFALKTDIPTTLPANGGMADAARETVSPNAKAKLWEDPEGGNLRLVSPDGNHSVEMDLYNNEGFRMYFTDNGELTFPVDYNSTTKKFNINGNADSVGGFNNRTIFRPYYLVSNANDCYTNGSYMCTPDTTNIPSANYGILVSFNGEGDKINNTWVCQNFYPTSSNYVYHRFWTNNTWTNWERMASVNDIPTSLPANGGNADTVDGVHINVVDDGHTYDWLACFTSTNEIRAINPNRAYVKNAGNADTANTAGTLATTASNICLRNISAGTADLSAGVSELATGAIYLVYE